MGQKLTKSIFRFIPVFAFLLASASVTFVQAQVQVTVTGTNITCHGDHNGTATANPSGGWFPYTYLWSNGATTQTITNLGPGNYCVTVTDIDLGTGTACINITEPTPLGVTVFGQSQICGNAPDGWAAVTPNGGTPPYSYLWSNGGITPQINNLAAGTYTVTVTDINGCTASGSFEVGFWNEGIWLMDTIYQEITCFGANNGWVHVSTMSGIGPYTYIWSNGGSTSDITNLGPGTYTVTVTDVATGCSNVASATLEEPAVLVCSPSSIPANCGLNGTATISVTGGTAPYSILWFNGQSTPSIAVPAGTYTVTVTDANGCTCSSSVVVGTNSIALTVDVIPTLPAGCLVGGSATAVATGGTSNYAYTWDNGHTTAIATNLSAGTHKVTVVDITTGCQGLGSGTILPATPIVPVATPTSPATCLTGGSATVAASGGVPPYTFKWDNNQTTPTATNLLAGQHSVTVTDASGCTAVATVTIDQSQGPSVSVVINNQATCVSGGTATAVATGGTTPYIYLWSASAGGQTTSVATNLPPGTHSVTVTDANNCSAVGMATITVPNAPVAVISSSTPSACGNNTGSATVSVSGGTPNYTYKWSNPGMTTTATISNLGAGTYTVTVTDAAGCTATTSVTIGSSQAPNVVIVASSNANCSTPGSATASVSGGTPAYMYNWSNGETTATAVNLPAGSYTVTVKDANNCTATATVTIGSTSNGIKIGDWVWYDDDQNGFQHPTLETGVPNIQVKLVKAGPDGAFGTPDDVVVETTTTNNAGFYFFNCVVPGTYVLEFSNKPLGYQWTKKDWVNNDCKDSDVKSNGKTDPFTIVAGQPDDLCFDAGIHTICENITNAGVICCSQTICEGETPAPITETVPPVGGSGQIQYVWMQFIQIGQAPPEWVAIQGATGSSYAPGPLFETAKFMRCARREGCPFLESNIVTITVLPAGSPGCDGFNMNFNLQQTGQTGVLVNWTTLPEATEYSYTVQHSTDMQSWTNVTTLMGKQDAVNPNEYSFMHETPAIGRNFYRIRRLSSMGQQAFSEIRAIEVQFSPSNGVLIAPNPVVKSLRIMNAISYDEDVVIQITATNGAVLHTITIPAGKMHLEDLPVQDLPSGIYMAKIRFGNGEVKTLKIVKI
ncbi:MAG: T9SS type A sorting domain-containing protein [Chitinophagales bacterium]|nr:T9SS type A sorting domain-containing protein [Chitinophagales bacterium]